MKKNLKNYEIEGILGVLNHKDSFRNNISVKLPKAVRQALKVNIKAMSERMEIYEEGRREIMLGYVEGNKADLQSDGNYKVKDEFFPELQQELNELAMVDNSLDLETVDMVAFDSIELSTPEEDVLELLFGNEEETEETE